MITTQTSQCNGRHQSLTNSDNDQKLYITQTRTTFSASLDVTACILQYFSRSPERGKTKRSHQCVKDTIIRHTLI